MGDLLNDLGWSYEENRDVVEKRIAAIVALGPLVSDLLVEKLVPGANEKAQRNLARNAARCLQRIGDTGVLPDLVRLSSHASPDVRADACLALGGLRDARSATALTARLEDAEDRVVLEAARALAALGVRPAAAAIAAKLARFPPQSQSFRALLGALADLGAPEGAELVLAQLGKIEDAESIGEVVRYAKNARAASLAGPLFDLLADAKRSSQQEKILEALGFIADGDRRILAGLKGYLENRSYSVRSAAAIALYRQKDKSGLPELLKQPEETIERSPREPWGYLARARVFFALDEWHKATLDYRKAAERVPRGERLEAAAVCEWAQCYAEQKQWEKALKTLRDEKVQPAEFIAWPSSKLPCFDRLREDPKHAEWFTPTGG
ncbi:MAG: HEAT repeat domain-containing protein [Planctomycetes bacterium]|nr:HEAT repeat domain-containing protein [Planctomycetota bacterium]